jgi:predicted transport protein
MMAQGAREIEQDFIATVQDKTGNTLDGWMAHLKTTGLTKTNDLIHYLKKEHSLNHLQSSMLAGIYLNDGKPVHDYDVLLAKLFEGNEAVRPLYDRLRDLIAAELPDSVVLIPTKAYVSIEGARVFACAKLNKKNIRVGLDLDMPFDDVVVPARSLGAMPNISHMVEITDIAQVDDRLAGLLRQAYDRRHSG